MDTPLLKITMSCFTCCLFIFHMVGGLPDLGDEQIHTLQSRLCLDEERSALWEFKQGLRIMKYGDSTSYHKTDSWKAGVDCCASWDGVECDQVTGHVIGLDLSGNFTNESYINGSISGNNALFQLVHLQKLNLSYNYLQGQIPSSIFHFSNLSSLDLSSYYYGLRLHKPSLQDLFHNLTKLEHLHLDGVDMTGSTLPDSLSNYSCLKSLQLSVCGLSAVLPSFIFHLPQLRILDLSRNPSLSGYFLECDGNNSLEELRIGFCNFSVLTSLGRLSSLTYLDISGNVFSGFESSSFFWLSNLTKLTHLGLMGMKINGKIPPQISYLTALNYLDLSYNELRGQMARAWLRNLTQLVTLDLSNNQLTGQIPSSLSTLTKLVTLLLNHNRLTGSIPSLTKLTHLQHIDLSLNRLEGEIPNSFSNLHKLQVLNLYSNNLNGTVALDLFHKLGDLSDIELSRNNLSLLVNEDTNLVFVDKYEYLGLGSCNLNKFPAFLLNQSSLLWLDLSWNNIHGKVPTWIWNHSLNIFSLNISHNFLTTIEDHPVMPRYVGKIPFSSLDTLDISFNMLQGSLPVPSLSTKCYLASNNDWTGHLSPLFCNLTDLRVLDVSNNNIDGTIPQCLATSGIPLMMLNLRSNNLHGTIPQSWMHGSPLQMIALSENQLHGKVPRSLGNCKMLEFIDFGNNQIADIFPSWLGALPELKVLMLQSNRFRGVIQNVKGDSQFSQLRIINLSFNGFVGKLPVTYFEGWKVMGSVDADKIMEYMEIELLWHRVYYISDIEYSMKIFNKGIERIYFRIPNLFIGIDFSHNQFEGEIPSSIAKLKGLHLLNLGHNDLTGTIPSWLGDLHQLESLDLSHNKLSGKIPQELSQLSFLSFFNVSYNNLSGFIPHGGQFDTFDNSSYESNPGLLTDHPTQPPTLTPTTGEEQDEPMFDKIDWMVILMGCGSGFIVGVVLGNELVVRRPLWFVKLLGRWL